MTTLVSGTPRSLTPEIATSRWEISLRSLRTQGAALFIVLAVAGSALMWLVAGAYQASDATQREQVQLLQWQYDSAQISLSAEQLRTHLAQFNNALLSDDTAGAQQSQDNAFTDMAAITSGLARISALQLPGDVAGVSAQYHDAAVALTSFGNQFIAGGKHTDDQMLAQVDGALATWRKSAAGVGPFINTEVVSNQALQDSRRNYVYNLLIAGALGFVLLLLLLALVQFRLTLRPIVQLARVASQLASGRPAIIRTSTRQDEIGQLTGALAGWQESSRSLMAGLGEASSRAALSASKLSGAAGQLASATAEQTSAATETSASMEELARTSTAIAETLERVTVQAQ